MIDGRQPGQGSGCGDEAWVGPLALLGPELDRVGGCGVDGELALTVEGDDRLSCEGGVCTPAAVAGMTHGTS